MIPVYFDGRHHTVFSWGALYETLNDTVPVELKRSSTEKNPMNDAVEVKLWNETVLLDN